MHCTKVKVGDVTAIVCTSGGRKPKKCAECGTRASSRECDWKIAKHGKKVVTCNKPMCDVCTFSPAPKKDLCPTHREAFTQWLKNKEQT